MDASTGWRDLRSPRAPTGLRPSPFSRLVITHALNSGGDALVTMALAGSLFFSISPTAARGRVTLSLVLTMAPFAVVAPLLGPAIDRSRRGKRIMVVGSCGGRALVAWYMTGVLHQLLLFPAAFSALVLSKGYAVAKTALVPVAVQDRGELVEANSKLAITSVLASLVVAVPGVPVLHFFGARWVLRMAAVVLAGAAIAAVRIEESPAPAAAVPDAAVERPAAEVDAAAAPPLPATEPWGTAPEALMSARVTLAAAAMALLRAIVGFLTFLVAFGFRHAHAPSWWFGVVLAATMAAGLLASAVAPVLRRVVREEVLIVSALLFVALVSVGVGRLSGRLWAALVGAGVAFGAGVAKLAFDSLVQQETPVASRGRSFARFEAGFQLVWVVGALLPVVIATPLSRGYDVMAFAAFTAALAYSVARRRLAQAARAR